jgi:hypothetical protein
MARVIETDELVLATATGGLWKAELAWLADETGLSTSVTHMPTGHLQWSKSSTGCFSIF